MPTAAAKRKPHLRSVPPGPRPVQLELPLPEPKWRDLRRPPLWHFVLLSMLLHVLGIFLFGAPSGGSREGRAMWGSLKVSLLVPAPEPPLPLKIDPGFVEPIVPIEPPALPRTRTKKGIRLKSAPAMRAPPPVEAARPEVPVVPPLLDRIVTPEPKPELPPLQVPPPTAIQVAPPPVAEPAPELSVPPPEAPIPLQRLQRPESVVIPAPALPPAERAPIAAPPVPALPITRPVEAPPIELKPIPVPTAESLSPAAPRVMELPPPREMPAVPQAPPAIERVQPRAPERTPPASLEREPPKLESPASSPAPSSVPAPSRAAPAKREAPSGTYDPTAPALDLDALRSRAGQIAREGTGRRAVLPFPMPPIPERKSKLEDALDKARKPDCRDAYKELGLAAIVPLLANEFGEGNCRW